MFYLYLVLMSNSPCFERLVQRLMGEITKQTGREFFPSYILDGWFLSELNRRLAREMAIDPGLLPSQRQTFESYLPAAGNRLMLSMVERQYEGL